MTSYDQVGRVLVGYNMRGEFFLFLVRESLEDGHMERVIDLVEMNAYHCFIRSNATMIVNSFHISNLNKLFVK